MSFNLSELIHIVSTLDDSLSMSEAVSDINISAGYEETDDCTEEFLKLFFPLKHGNVEIKISDSTGIFSYLDSNGESLKSVEFDDHDVASITGSFRKSLKQIWAFDRQNISSTNTNTSLNRASFGLTEVN